MPKASDSIMMASFENHGGHAKRKMALWQRMNREMGGMLKRWGVPRENKQAGLAEDEKSAFVDPAGRLVLPAGVAHRFGLEPGAEVPFDLGENSIRLRRPMARPARIYVEATTRCNMACDMCQRHTWSEAPADMTEAVFYHLV